METVRFMRALNWLYIVFFSVNALTMAIVTGLTGVDWSNFSKTQQFVVACAVAASWSNTMLALVVTLAKREVQGKPLIPTDETNQWTKQQFAPPSEPQTPKPKET